MATSSGNILLIQSGGCTPVINSTLAGLIENGQTLFPQSRIYGGIHGIEGVIDGKILDITELSNSQLKSLAAPETLNPVAAESFPPIMWRILML